MTDEAPAIGRHMLRWAYADRALDSLLKRLPFVSSKHLLTRQQRRRLDRQKSSRIFPFAMASRGDGDLFALPGSDGATTRRLAAASPSNHRWRGRARIAADFERTQSQ